MSEAIIDSPAISEPTANFRCMNEASKDQVSQAPINRAIILYYQICSYLRKAT